MTAKEYLSRYHKMKVEIQKLQSLVNEYIRLANEIPGVNFDSIRVNGTKNLKAPFEKWIIKTIDYEVQIKKMKSKLPIIKAEILKAIEQIKDSELERLLILRYIKWNTWNEISSKMYLSNATVRRRHSQAINKIMLPERLSRDEQV